MRTINVNKDVVLKALKKNKEKHEQEYAELVSKYKESVLNTAANIVKICDEMDSMFHIQVLNKEIEKLNNIVKPDSHIEDYEQVIGMLEICNDKELDISQSEYACYFEDNWAWRTEFEFTKFGYGIK